MWCSPFPVCPGPVRSHHVAAGPPLPCGAVLLLRGCRDCTSLTHRDPAPVVAYPARRRPRPGRAGQPHLPPVHPVLACALPLPAHIVARPRLGDSWDASRRARGPGGYPLLQVWALSPLPCLCRSSPLAGPPAPGDLGLRPLLCCTWVRGPPELPPAPCAPDTAFVEPGRGRPDPGVVLAATPSLGDTLLPVAHTRSLSRPRSVSAPPSFVLHFSLCPAYVHGCRSACWSLPGCSPPTQCHLSPAAPSTAVAVPPDRPTCPLPRPRLVVPAYGPAPAWLWDPHLA